MSSTSQAKVQDRAKATFTEYQRAVQKIGGGRGAQEFQSATKDFVALDATLTDITKKSSTTAAAMARTSRNLQQVLDQLVALDPADKY